MLLEFFVHSIINYFWNSLAYGRNNKEKFNFALLNEMSTTIGRLTDDRNR